MPEVEKGHYYPEMPPALDGESPEQYTDRLTGADNTGRRPYDHRRFRQCSIGYHEECSDPAGENGCECPCHTDPDELLSTDKQDIADLKAENSRLAKNLSDARALLARQKPVLGAAIRLSVRWSTGDGHEDMVPLIKALVTAVEQAGVDAVIDSIKKGEV